MGKKSSADVGFLLIDGYDVMSDTTKFEDNVEALTEETHGLGKGWVEHKYTGVKSLEVTQEGFYDDAEKGTNEALCDQSGTNRIVCYGINGNTIGQKFIGFEGLTQVNFKRIATRGELHKANAEYNGNGQVDEGIILHPHGIRTADGDTEADAVDNGAATTAGGAAYLQVSELDLDGHTSVVIKILHKAATGEWGELATFTAVAAAPAKERKIAVGSIKQNLAVSWEFTGSPADPEPSIEFMVGFARF